MTYYQYKTILATLEAHKQDMNALVADKPKSQCAKFLAHRASEAITELRAAFNKPAAVISRRAS